MSEFPNDDFSKQSETLSLEHIINVYPNMMKNCMTSPSFGTSISDILSKDCETLRMMSTILRLKTEEYLKKLQPVLHTYPNLFSAEKIPFKK
jgi:hypothetical protein